MHIFLSAAILLEGLAVIASASDAPPPMGFNTWNHFKCNINEFLIKRSADKLISSGLARKGYLYVNLDDCWSLMNRDPVTKRIVADPQKFPSGMKALADYLHERGLKFGLYADSGSKTCKGYPGSANHEELDALTFAEWGVDYLKYDNCYTNPLRYARDRYETMNKALKKTGRDIFYSLCSVFQYLIQWGQESAWTWGSIVGGNSWRISGDIGDLWKSNTYFQYFNCPCTGLYCPYFVPSGGHDCSIMNILNKIALVTEYTGKGGLNDPDVLEVGNGGMSTDEYKSHFSFWAALKAPLLIGTDLESMSNETLGILSNEEVIAINQDSLRSSIKRVKTENLYQIWAGKLQNSDIVILALNLDSKPQTIPIDVSSLFINTSSRTSANQSTYFVKDLWSKEETSSGEFLARTIQPHAVWMARLTQLV